MHRKRYAFGQWSALVFLILGMLATAQPSHAAAGELCFSQVEYCISGRFRQYWEQNGGLAVFGYPTSRATEQRNPDTGKTYLTQWFERNRFELHPENKAPYDVLLGRLGAQWFEQRSLVWQELPRDVGPTQGCLWFPQTQRNVCDQAGGGFKTYWQTHGLADPKLNAYERSLALFGLPLTGARAETNSSGEQVITQWFERARFEWHPNKPREFRVLLGLVGNEVQTSISTDPIGKAISVTFAFYTALHDGRYNAASQLYGGNYDLLRGYNPYTDPNDKAGLLNAACTQNGFQCLRPAALYSVGETSDRNLVFELSFLRSNGNLYKDRNGRTEFPVTVRIGNDGRYRVQELPPYSE